MIILGFLLVKPSSKQLRTYKFEEIIYISTLYSLYIKFIKSKISCRYIFPIYLMGHVRLIFTISVQAIKIKDFIRIQSPGNQFFRTGQITTKCTMTKIHFQTTSKSSKLTWTEKWVTAKRQKRIKRNQTKRN